MTIHKSKAMFHTADMHQSSGMTVGSEVQRSCTISPPPPPPYGDMMNKLRYVRQQKDIIKKIYINQGKI